MDSKPALVLLGLVTLFLGGIVGGVLGSALVGRAAAQQTPTAATPGSAISADDPELVGAIQALVEEVRRVRSTPTGSVPRGRVPSAREATERRPVGEGDAPALDSERVVAALERLTLALQAAQGRASPGGIGITPLVLPVPGAGQAALQDLVGRDWEEISAEYRFWTFQQVLDRFGRPDEVSNDRWIYKVPRGDGEEVFTFQFSQGYLMNVYD